MPADALPKVMHCHACQARLHPGAEKCWLCGALVTADAGDSVANVSAALPPTTAPRPATSFSLATLMLFVTLVAIVCGVFYLAPGLGAIMGLVLLPVMTHTVISVRRVESLGATLGTQDQIAMFFGSLSLVVAAGVAAAIAFGVTCAGGFFAGAAAGESLGAKGYDSLGWGMAGGLGLGAIGGGYVGYRAIVYLSQKSNWQTRTMPPLSLRNKLTLAAASLLAIIGAIIAVAMLS
jgi:hypothetical protein